MQTLLIVILLLVSPAVRAKSDEGLKELKRIQEENSRLLADTAQQVLQLRQEVQALRGMVEENKYFFQQESDKNGKILKDFDFRLTGIEERIGLHQKQLEEFLQKPPVRKGAAAEGEEGDYRRALTEVNLGNYAAAIRRFDEFAKKYPASSLVDNAQYWKGESFYALKDFAKALLEFQKVVNGFPKSEKVPGAILKQGYCLYEQQQYLDARAFLNKVIGEYPQSDEAGEARERLKKIESLPPKPRINGP